MWESGKNLSQHVRRGGNERRVHSALLLTMSGDQKARTSCQLVTCFILFWATGSIADAEQVR